MSSSSGGPIEAFDSTPLSVVTTDSGSYALRIFGPASGVLRGLDTLRIVITTSSGVAADNLDVVVVPWMPAMGHGASVVPSVEAVGGGAYVATDVALFMPGTWQLRITIDATDAAVANVAID